MKLNKVIRIYAGSLPKEFDDLNKLLKEGWIIKEVIKYNECSDYILEEVM